MARLFHTLCRCLPLVAFFLVAQAEEPPKLPPDSSPETNLVGTADTVVKVRVISLVPDGMVCKGSLKGPGQTRFIALNQPIVIYGNFAKASPGDVWGGPVYPAGISQYPIPGTAQTMRAYAVSKVVAFDKSQAVEHPRDEIPPPFGLAWGYPARLLRALMAERQIRIASQSTRGHEVVWHVEGLLAENGVNDTVFGLRDGKLALVAMFYQKPGWNHDRYTSYFHELELSFRTKYGEATGKVGDSTPGEVPWLEKKWAKGATSLTLSAIHPADNAGADRIQIVYLKD